MRGDAGGVRTWAHVTAFGRNVIEVNVWPRDHISHVAVLLHDHGEWTPVLMDEDGRPAALISWSSADRTDADLAAVVDLISSDAQCQGLGHAPFHDHEFGHTHLFRPVGRPADDPYRVPVFIQGTQMPQGHIELWFFGCDQPLRNVADQLIRHLVDEVTPVEGPDGWTAAMCELRGDDARADYAVLEDLLGFAGWDVHLRALYTPPREE